MPKLLTYEQIEEIGAERILELARDLKPMIAKLQPASLVHNDTISSTALLCAQVVGEAMNAVEQGGTVELVIASLFTSGMRLGYALAFDEIEQDQALIKRVTGD